MSKIAAIGTTPMLPGATAAAKQLARKVHIPLPGTLPAMSASSWKPPPGLTAAAQAAETIRPGKVASADLAAFLNELEKIAGDNDLLKEAILGALRQGLQAGVGRAATAIEAGGMSGAGKMLHAFNAPLETGAAGKGLIGAGQHIAAGAGQGLLGHLQYGVGKDIERHGQDLAEGGLGAIGKAVGKVTSPVGSLAGTALGTAGHAVVRGAAVTPGTMGHHVLTKVLPKAGEILGGAVMAPGGVDTLGGLAHNAVRGTATHVGTGLAGAGISKLRGIMPRKAVVAAEE